MGWGGWVGGGGWRWVAAVGGERGGGVVCVWEAGRGFFFSFLLTWNLPTTRVVLTVSAVTCLCVGKVANRRHLKLNVSLPG
jgi:hypothetical protein